MEKGQNNLKWIKLALLGDIPVGKTAIYNTFNNIEFAEDALTTIELDKLETKFTLENGKEIKLIIQDTNGQERFCSVLFKTIIGVQGIILVFDFTCRQTFENLESWLEKIKDNFKDDIPIVLFGNKIDIEKEKWQVTSEEAKKYAKKKDLVLFETSAKTKQGINEGIAYITNKVYNLISGKRMGKKNDINEKHTQNQKSKNLNFKKLLKHINF